MKKYLYITIGALAVVAAHFIRVNKENCERWERAEANVKAYQKQFSHEKSVSAALNLTVEQLKYSEDSLLQELAETKKTLKIKDKNLEAIAAIKSKFIKRDTITLKDTIFKEPTFALDTTIKDNWYSVQVGLKYPSMVAVSPSFISNKHLVVSTKKETINPPKKFWLFRLFQKKHTVLTVDVVEKNPYVKDELTRYVKIMK